MTQCVHEPHAVRELIQQQEEREEREREAQREQERRGADNLAQFFEEHKRPRAEAGEQQTVEESKERLV